MPVNVADRYGPLYKTFADEWRVTSDSSLFAYAPGTSTDSFTFRNWPPPLNSPCTIPNGQIHGVQTTIQLKPVTLETAKQACSMIKETHARQNCIVDTQATGSLDFARAYRLSERVVDKSTRTTVISDKMGHDSEERAVLTATVAQARADAKEIPTGWVQFFVNGRKAGRPIRLDANGQARWKSSTLRINGQQISARYIPDKMKRFSPSVSALQERSTARN